MDQQYGDDSVISAPAISEQPLSATITEGGTATLVVRASGSALAYQWFRDDAAIDGATSSSHTTSTAGTYHAVVSNPSGSVTSADATVTVSPNVVAPYLIMLTAFIAQAILAEASLSFLGLGVAEPTAAWGLMLSGNAADFYREAPWMILFPGAAISLAVFAFNLFGDALRDYLDPRFKV